MDHVIVVGDPGAGKSTILNGLVGTAARGPRMPFRSGLSVASGRTIALQTDVVGGVRYSDTPGLDDVALKRQAAAAIANAVCLGGAVRLLFVLTMEAGRVRGANFATIRIVLDALTAVGVDVDGRFSVALNHGRDGSVGGPGHRRRGGAAVAAGHQSGGRPAGVPAPRRRARRRRRRALPRRHARLPGRRRRRDGGNGRAGRHAH